MSKRSTIDWSDDMLRQIADLWDEGVSVANIAKALSEHTCQDVTKNMVSGKVHRMGLKRRESPIQRFKVKRVREKPAKPEPRPLPALAPPKAMPAPKLIQLYLDTLAESDATRCKWICGQVVKPEPRKTRRHNGVNYTLREPNVMVFDPEPVYSRWADVPRCENAQYQGHPYCHAHCLRAFVDFGVIKEDAAE